MIVKIDRKNRSFEKFRHLTQNITPIVEPFGNRGASGFKLLSEPFAARKQDKNIGTRKRSEDLILQKEPRLPRRGKSDINQNDNAPDSFG